MSRKLLQLTFACGDYEIMRALKEGIVQPEGIELTVLTDMAPSPRHWRFLRGCEFDVAEVSGSGYVAARDQDLPFRAIPVFPHRRFRHGFIFVNTSKGISKPTDLIRPLTAGDKRVGRLFPNYKAEEMSFYKKTGIFPIMHVVGIKQEIVERHPWVATNMYKAFEQAKSLAMERMENPRIVPLAWYREGWEEQEAILGKDPWEYGLGERNARNFERLVTYSHEQGLIKRRHSLDELFLNVSEGRKRDEFRI